MEKVKCVILGAGIAGLSCARELTDHGIECTIYEKEDHVGGLCHSFQVNGFSFDSAVHLSFTNSDEVRSVFDQTPYLSHKPIAYNFYDGMWVKHPIMNNLYEFPVEERVRLISSLAERDSSIPINNYEDYLHASYGVPSSEKFFDVYTRKYWTAEPEELSTSWVGNRLAKPDLQKILRGAMQLETGMDYYAKEMRYPENGGYESFLNPIKDGLDIHLSKEAVSIDTESKVIEFSDGETISYDYLFTSIPLPKLIEIIKAKDEAVIENAKELSASSISIVSVGFNKPDVAKYLWMYVYDEDIKTARIYSPSLKSPNNVPDGCSSLQFEIYHNPGKELLKEGKSKSLSANEEYIPEKNDILENVRYSIKKMNLCNDSDIAFMDYRYLPYGNVIFYKGMEEHRQVCRDFLNGNDIYGIGRFGEWDYLWSDQSYLSGKRTADKLIDLMSV